MYEGTNPKALQSMKRIEDALVKLMQDSPYENVSVTAICKEAGISRPTFYKNFNDKDEVISSVFGKAFDRAKDCFRAGESSEVRDAVKLFIAQFDDKELSQRILSNGKLFELFQARLLESLNNETGSLAHAAWPPERMEYLHAFYSGGLACLLLYWGRQDDSVSIEELGEIAANLVDGTVFANLK